MIIANCYLPDSPGGNPPQAAERIGKCLARANKLSKHLISCRHNPVTYEKALKRCKSSEAWLVAARFRDNTRRELRRRETPKQILECSNLGFWEKAPNEVVIVRAKQKSNGGYRPVCTFGPDFSMMHEASTAILHSIFVPKPWQFDYSGAQGGGGLSRAIAYAVSAAKTGMVYYAKADVRRFYPSFDVKECGETFSPHEKMITVYLGGGHVKMMSKLPLGLSSIIHKEARQGGLIGSRFSSRMGGLIMSQMDWDGPCVLINYVDDFLILGQSQTDVEIALAALKSKILALPGGHFILHDTGIGHLYEGATFLGHALSLDATGVQITCSAKATNEFWKRLEMLDMVTSKICQWNSGVHKTEELTASLGKMLIYARSWGEAFKFCADAEGYVQAASYLKKELQRLGASPGTR